MGFFSNLAKGADGRPEGEAYTQAGRAITCSHCGNNRFWTREAQLNTAGLSFLDLDFLNKSAEVYVCTNCGHLEWFL